MPCASICCRCAWLLASLIPTTYRFKGPLPHYRSAPKRRKGRTLHKRRTTKTRKCGLYNNEFKPNNNGNSSMGKQSDKAEELLANLTDWCQFQYRLSCLKCGLRLASSNSTGTAGYEIKTWREILASLHLVHSFLTIPSLFFLLRTAISTGHLH